jgi:hypothetical protein
MEKRFTHWVSPKVEARANLLKGGFGLYAKTFIAKGELVVGWGGDVVTGAQLAQLSFREQEHTIQIEDDLYQVPVREPEAGDYANHSCEPNAGMSSSITLVTIRDVWPGEEICFDYAMSDSTPYCEFSCGCGTPSCRGQVTGNDWMLPELQAKYDGYFSPYLQRRIDRMRLERMSQMVEVEVRRK